MVKLELDAAEMAVMIKSLEHCLQSCRQKATHPNAPCPDCEVVRLLLEKVKEADR